MRQYSGIWTLSQVAQAISDQNWPGQPPPNVEYLVVAGGAGGGFGGGGGGAGGLLAGYAGITSGSSYTVTVGGGGTGGTSASRTGGSGSNSVFGSITATGGGGGGGSGTNPASGGSGGGGGGDGVTFGASGTSGQGNAGGSTTGISNVAAAAGGGGAGTVGLPNRNSNGNGGGNGGAGIASAISGTVTTYAGGGGGSFNIALQPSGGAGVGGVGGGGGGAATAGSGSAGTANTGGGGGGGTSGSGGDGGAGGSGVVIISYPDTYRAAASTTGSPTVSTSGSGSLLCNTTVGTNGFRYSGETQFVFGTGDFTIEFWTNVTSFSTYPTFIDFRNVGGSGNGPIIFCMTNGELRYYSNGADRILSGATVLSLNTWYHIALCRIGTATKLYLNGAQVGSTYTDSTNYVCASTGPHILINCDENSGRVDGNTTNIRIVKGVGVYTGTFTPPTAPLQATQSAGTNIAAITGTQTSLLLNSVSGAFLTDSSTYSLAPKSATTNPNPPVWNQLSPFATGLGYKNRVYTWTSSGSITF